MVTSIDSNKWDGLLHKYMTFPTDLSPTYNDYQKAIGSAFDFIQDNETTHGFVKVTIDGQEFRVNPRQIEWSKGYKVQTFEIPYYKDKNQNMGDKLWQLSMTLRTLRASENSFLWNLGDKVIHPGPHLIVTAGAANGAMCMILKNKRQTQVQAEGDNTFLWQLDFEEGNEAN